MRRFLPPVLLFALVQLVLLIALRVAYLSASEEVRVVLERSAGETTIAPVQFPRREPLRVTPLYNRPDLVSDEQLAMVLNKIIPRFSRQQLKPNFVEHAIRVWTASAQFQDPDAIDGPLMRDTLIDTAAFIQSWQDRAEPLLQPAEQGIAVRWGRDVGASVHHDHMLASLTEAGTPVDQPVYLQNQRAALFGDVVQQALLDFRLDERETEWTALAFGLWLAPQSQWRGGDGRQYSFDLLAERLLRGHLEMGVCSGTHRIYSLMTLVRLDDDWHILAADTRAAVLAHLADIRDRIVASQFEDGHWPSNWADGSRALLDVRDDELHTRVIATGHHLEWLAIAPEELHPPAEVITKAMNWCLRTTDESSLDDVAQRYTFFSHVGNALALWRSEQPHQFWQRWEAEHPFVSSEPAAAMSDSPTEP